MTPTTFLLAVGALWGLGIVVIWAMLYGHGRRTKRW